MTRLLAIAFVVTSGCAARPAAPAVEALLPASAERGAVVYRKACASCHGERGDGKGPGARALDPEPRDFTRGVFRYRSTPTGSLPRDEDLQRTVSLGLPGTAMPAFGALLQPQEVRDVVAYVKHFSPRFAAEAVEEPVAVPEPAAYTPKSVARGKVAYEKAQCARCHGERGRGDGFASEDELEDDQGRPVRPRDFTRGIYRSGHGKRDLWRTLYTGLDGSPMPAYEGALPGEELSDLVNYLLSLEQDRGVFYWLTTPPRWYEPGEQRVAR